MRPCYFSGLQTPARRRKVLEQAAAASSAHYLLMVTSMFQNSIVGSEVLGGVKAGGQYLRLFVVETMLGLGANVIQRH